MAKQTKPNGLLRSARLARLSPSGSGRPLSRQELADAVNTQVYAATGKSSVSVPAMSADSNGV